MNGCFFLLLLLTIAFVDGEQKCPTKNITPCTCHEFSSQIRCENLKKAELDRDKLNTIFKDLTGDYLYLLINKTQLETISAETFSKMTFEKIFIEQNNHLTNIAENAFKNSNTTKVLSIRNNLLLAEDNLFTIARKFGVGLLRVELDKNKIKTIPTDAFSGDSLKNIFQSLEFIRLDDQHGDKIDVLPSNSFSNLPALQQLSLDKNNIETIAINAIDLKQTLKTGGHVGIWLSDNKLQDITEMQIVLDDSNKKLSVSMMLENNNIQSIKDGIFDKIIDNKGYVLLRGNINLKCDCQQIPKLKISPYLNKIILPQNIKCLKTANRVEISECK